MFSIKQITRFFLEGKSPTLRRAKFESRIEGKINLLVTFIQQFVTQSQLSLIFTKKLLFPHKAAYFSNNSLNAYKNTDELS